MSVQEHAPSARVRDRMRNEFTFQISVDTDNVPQGLAVAGAAVNAGIDLIEIGTPLCKYEGVRNVVPIFRQRFPEALILADMKTMDGGGFEARSHSDAVPFKASSRGRRSPPDRRPRGRRR